MQGYISFLPYAIYSKTPDGTITLSCRETRKIDLQMACRTFLWDRVSQCYTWLSASPALLRIPTRRSGAMGRHGHLSDENRYGLAQNESSQTHFRIHQFHNHKEVARNIIEQHQNQHGIGGELPFLQASLVVITTCSVLWAAGLHPRSRISANDMSCIRKYV